MEENRFVCPDCGGNLEFWEELIYEQRTTIYMDGTVAKPSLPYRTGETGCCGYICVKCKKSTYANGDSDFENDETFQKFINDIDWNSEV